MSNKVPRSQPSLRSTFAERAEAAAHAAAAGERRRRRLAIAVGSALATVVLVGAITFVVLRSRGDEAVAPSAEAVALGCSSCHTTDGQRSEGPTWKGLAGSTVTLADGSTVVADDAYLRRAITDPAADVVTGYTASMPTIEVTDAQLAALVAFIDSLR
ncbi:MAG: cytochrome c [Acidimicrobiales bacterium]|nr:cytochrome c [Acidimicrobiales bacterium]